MTKDMSGALRYDAGKPQFHHLHPVILFSLAPCLKDDPMVRWFFCRDSPLGQTWNVHKCVKVLEAGAAKYGHLNYAGGMLYSRVFNSYLRHTTRLYYFDQKEDTETGLPHQDHAQTNVMFAQLYHKLGYDGGPWDDRPKDLAWNPMWAISAGPIGLVV
jgi:hypothetical protein